MLSMVDLRLLNHSYEFSLTEKDVTYLGKGDVNSVYLGKTAQGQYVIKKINGTQQSRDFNKPIPILIQSINFSEMIAQQLLSTEHVCVAIFQGDNCVIENEGQLLITYPYVQGVVREDEQISIAMVTEIATFLKTVHQTQFHYDESFAAFKKKAFYDVGRTIIDHSIWSHIQKFVPAQLFKKLHAVSSHMIAHRKAFHDAFSAPTHDVICHNDLKPKNVLWRDQHDFTVMDWEASGLMDITVDYLDTFFGWNTDYHNHHCSMNKERALAFIKAYPIPGEISAANIKILIIKCYYWLAFCLSKVIKNPFTWRQYSQHIRTSSDFIDYLIQTDIQQELKNLEKN